MKVSGTATLHAPRDRVWEALNDPAVLVRTIPGCLELRETGQDSYRMLVNAGVASIKGLYQGDVKLTDQHAPDSFILHAAGSGGPGTVNADVKVTLSEAGGETKLEYDADAVVGGTIGGVGQRVLTGVAKKTAGEFFKAVDDVLTGKAVEIPAPAAAADERAPAAPGAAATAAAPAAEGVYRSPAAMRGAAAGLPGSEFAKGAIFGAAIALVGALVGGWLARRH
jgi:carbon monoxide dehydrogenase subunit G